MSTGSSPIAQTYTLQTIVIGLHPSPHCGQIYNDSRFEVAGIGTVELNVKFHKRYRGGQTNSRIITLHDVLFAPSSVCNIFGQPSSSDYGFQLDFSQNGGTLIDQDGNRAGLIEISKLPHLRLHGRRGGWSSLDADAEYMTNAHWPDTERARWNAHQAGRQSIPVIPSDGDAPYSTEEKAWLKKNFGGEYKFLRSFGLSIYDEEDRTNGRSIVRSMMMEDGGEPRETDRECKMPVLGGRNYDNEGEDEDDDDDELDNDGFLQEPEDDPMSHFADYNFSPAELNWIQKHYQYSSKFMLSYGLKPFEQEDCDEARAIVRAMMED